MNIKAARTGGLPMAVFDQSYMVDIVRRYAEYNKGQVTLSFNYARLNGVYEGNNKEEMDVYLDRNQGTMIAIPHVNGLIIQIHDKKASMFDTLTLKDMFKRGVRLVDLVVEGYPDNVVQFCTDMYDEGYCFAPTETHLMPLNRCHSVFLVCEKAK